MRPRFTIGLLYLFGFFFIYALALVAPALFEVLRSMEPGPEMEQRAYEVARDTAGPRLRFALVAAIATMGLGMLKGWLPGTQE